MIIGQFQRPPIVAQQSLNQGLRRGGVTMKEHGTIRFTLLPARQTRESYIPPGLVYREKRVTPSRMMEKGRGVAISWVVSSKASMTLFLFLVASFFAGARATEFCASTNTGSSFPSGRCCYRPDSLIAAVYSLYQSVGACSGTCSGYAFAILQGHVANPYLDIAHKLVMLVFELFPTSRSILKSVQRILSGVSKRYVFFSFFFTPMY